MKNKIYIVLTSVFIVAAISYAGLSISKESKNNIEKVTTKTSSTEKLIGFNEPEVDYKKHIEGVSKKLFEDPKEKEISIELTPEKRRELEGKINKEYGIREDILRYIDKEIPANNEVARRAAIRLMADEQKIYYGGNLDEALPLMNKTFISLHCLQDAIESQQEGHRVYQELMHFMEDTRDREKYTSNFDRKVFGWKTIGFGNITNEELVKACETGVY